MGQKYLASGVHVAMRLWDEEPDEDKAPSIREYETVGYVLEGRAELHLEGQLLLLQPGDSWVVPAGSLPQLPHRQTLRAVEATSPPAHAHGRDEPMAGVEDEDAKRG